MDSDNDLELLRSSLLKLTAAQQLAVEALVGGATQSAAAQAADVTRETVSRWAGHHPAFRASLNLWRSTVAQEQVDTARRIRGKALASIETALDKGEIDPLAVLRALGDGTTSMESILPEELLDAEFNKVRANLPPAPLEPGLDGLLDSLLAPSSNAERAENLTITRLATASGVLPPRSEAGT